MEDLIEAYLSVYEESDVAKRTREAVGHQRKGTYGGDHEMERESEESTKAVKKATRHRGPKVTPSLPESYDEFDEGYEELPVDKMMAKSKSITRRQRKPGEPRWTEDDQRASDIRKAAGTHSRAKVKKIEQANRARGNQQEQVDLFDVVLNHLLDEGFADTEQNAITIMANMSEEWIDGIIDEASVYGARKGTIRSVIGKGGKSIKYVQSGGDIVAGDKAAQARASAASTTRDGRNRANAARFQQAAKKSIQTLNANPGEDPENYGNTDDDHSGGERHYKLKHTNRADRQRRAKG